MAGSLEVFSVAFLQEQLEFLTLSASSCLKCLGSSSQNVPLNEACSVLPSLICRSTKRNRFKCATSSDALAENMSKCSPSQQQK